MKKVKIRGINYLRDDNGVLIPEAFFVREGAKIARPEDAVQYLAAERGSPQECFVVLTLDAGHKLIKKHVVTIGLANKSQVHPRETFRPAVLDNAIGIMIAHNHPSGSLEASVDDLMTTRRLCEAAKIMGIPLVDHIIVTAEGFVSLREKFPDYFIARGERE